MAILRHLPVNQPSIYSIKAVIRAISKTRNANHHYWAARLGKAYGRSQIYSKDAYYIRWATQRSSQYTRPCGSWARRDRESLKQKQEDEEDPRSASHPDQKLNSSPERPRNPFASDHFFQLLRQDPSAAYKYIHREIEKDPHRWLSRSKEDGSAWNAVEWWNRRMRIFGGRRKVYYDGHLTVPKTPEPLVATPPVSESVKDEEYWIDPITMRKVLVAQVSNAAVEQENLYPRYQPQSTENDHEIPVQTYVGDGVSPIKSSRVPDNITSNDETKKRAGFANQTWLVKEGFAALEAKSSKIEPNSIKSASEDKSSVKLEPSLDRIEKARAKVRDDLQYPPKEVTTDDVDLLRSSDIRATSGRSRTKSIPTQGEIKERSEALEKDWNSREKAWTEDITNTHNQIVENRKASSASSATKAAESKSRSLAMFQQIKQLHDTLQHKIEETASLLDKARADALQDVLSRETTSMKQNFDSFEQRSRKHVMASTDTEDVSQLPNDDKLIQDKLDSQQKKLEKLEKDAKLVKQIRDIYEEKYGKITADHKQGVFKGVKHDPDETISKAKSGSTESQAQAKSTTAEQSNHTKSDADARKVDISKGITMRDLLNRGIDGFAMSSRSRKRLKFATRGVHQLDIVIPGLAEDILATSQASAASDSVSEPARKSKDEHQAPVKKTKEFAAKEQSQSVSKHDKKSKPELTKQEISHVPEKASTNKTHESAAHRQQHSENLYHKKPEEKSYIYKILALDAATNEVVVATANGNFRHKTSLPRSTAAVLVHLDQPARYFSHIEKLDSENYRIVSGSRSMLVFRKEIRTDGTSVERSIEEVGSQTGPRLMTPLREEAVFTGHLKPKQRLLRSYQLAHRRARAGAQDTAQKDKSLPEMTGDSKESIDQPIPVANSKKSRNWRSTLTTALVVLTVCYTIGLIRSMKERKERLDSAVQRYYEVASDEVEARANKRNWF